MDNANDTRFMVLVFSALAVILALISARGGLAETSPAVDLAGIEDHLRRDPYLNLYGLGDLDGRFREHTTWYTRTAGGRIEAATLLYGPALLALAAPPAGELRHLVQEVLPCLPDRMQCHLSAGLDEILAARYRLSVAHPHLKMGLLHLDRLDEAPDAGAMVLTEADADALMGRQRL